MVKKKIDSLVELLNEASKAYYNGLEPIMSDSEWDNNYNLLVALERQHPACVRADSPTKNVGFSVVSSLEKVTHKTPQISLDKRYDVEEVVSYFADKRLVGSIKCDGLTLVCTYENGILVDAVTRGNGVVGERVLSQACAITNLPLSIPYDGLLKVRGECLMTYSAFNEVNSKLPEGEKSYSSPRNLASGTIRSLDVNVVKERKLCFYAFELLSSDMEFVSEFLSRKWLEGLGFECAHYAKLETSSDIRNFISLISEQRNSSNLNIPIDGVVFTVDNLDLRSEMGTTEKYPLYSLAYKFPNKGQTTIVTDIKWQSGIYSLTPVVSVEPLDFDGVTVTKATAHNLNFVCGCDENNNACKSPLYIGATIRLERSGEVIPKIAEVYGDAELSPTEKSILCANIIPTCCPACGGEVKQEGVELVCLSDSCSGKLKARLRHMVSRDCLNIRGFGDKTVDALVDTGFIKKPSDVFGLHLYKDELVTMEGLGEKSVNQLLDEINNCRKVELPNVIKSLAIEGVGLHVGKTLVSSGLVKNIVDLLSLDVHKLVEVDGVGNVLAKNLANAGATHSELITAYSYYGIGAVNNYKAASSSKLNGYIFVITGTLSKDRKYFEDIILENGGKVSGSVSSKTSYVLIGDSPGANKKNAAIAKDIPLLNENDFLALLQ